MTFGALALVSFFSQHDGELCFAGFAGIVEGGAFAVAFGSAEEKSLLGGLGEADEAGFAVAVGSNLEVELVEAHKSVSDMDADVGGGDGRPGLVGDDEIGGAGAEAGIDFGHGFGVDGGGGTGPRSGK